MAVIAQLTDVAHGPLVRVLWCSYILLKVPESWYSKEAKTYARKQKRWTYFWFFPHWRNIICVSVYKKEMFTLIQSWEQGTYFVIYTYFFNVWFFFLYWFKVRWFCFVPNWTSFFFFNFFCRRDVTVHCDFISFLSLITIVLIDDIGLHAHFLRKRDTSLRVRN